MSYAEGFGDAADATADDAAPIGALPLSPSLLVDELDSAIRLLTKHRARFVQLQQGALSETQVNAVAVEAIGELLYLASKVESLARTLNGEGRG